MTGNQFGDRHFPQNNFDPTAYPNHCQIVHEVSQILYSGRGFGNLLKYQISSTFT